MKKTVLVTGASGFVGRNLCHVIQRDGHNLQTFSYRYGQDIRDYEQIRQVLTQTLPDEVHHLAAQAYVPETTTNPKRGFDINVLGTLNLMRAIAETGSRARIHIAGTSEEYGYETHPGEQTISELTLPIPTTLYGASKLAAGQLALTMGVHYGIPVVVTRAWNHTGPGQPSTYAIPSFARQVAMVEAGLQEKVRHGNLSAKRLYLDVRDVVAAYRLVFDRKLSSGVYNVALPNHLDTMIGYLQALITLTDKEIPLEADEKLYRPGTQQGSGIFPRPDATKFRMATGWEQEFSMVQTLTDVLDFWRGEVND